MLGHLPLPHFSLNFGLELLLHLLDCLEGKGVEEHPLSLLEFILLCL